MEADGSGSAEVRLLRQRLQLMRSLRMSLFYVFMREQALRLLELFIHVDSVVRRHRRSRLQLQHEQPATEELTPEQVSHVSHILRLLDRTVAHLESVVRIQEYSRLSEDVGQTSALVTQTRQQVIQLQRRLHFLDPDAVPDAEMED